MDTDSNQPVLKRYLNQQGKLHRAWGLGDSRIIVNFVDIIVPLWSAGGKKAYFQRYIHRWDYNSVCAPYHNTASASTYWPVVLGLN